jgi:hypothetical protein
MRKLILLYALLQAIKRYRAQRRQAAERRAENARLDEALDESFPASDPPAPTIPGTGRA